MKLNMKKYIEVDFKKGYPSGENIFYECQICGNEIPSLPKNEVAECKCKNVLVDISSARIGARDESRVKVFKNI
jgi:hypothetical protein